MTQSPAHLNTNLLRLRAKQIDLLVLICIQITAAYWIGALLIAPHLLKHFRINIPLIFVLVLLLLLVRLKRIQAASILLVIGLWGALVLVSFFNGGVSSPSYSGLVLVTLCAGLLVGRRAAFVCAGTSILVGLGLVYLTITNMLTPMIPLDPFGTWIANAMYFLGAGAVLHVATSSISVALQDAEHRLNERNAIELRLRKREQELEQRERDYRQAIIAADAVPYYRDFQTDRYTFMGDGITHITGYPVELITPDFFGTLEEAITMRADAAELDVEEAIEQARTGKMREWRCDLLIRTHAGELRWLADSAVQTFDEHGVVIGSFGILQDITERKQAEQALQESEERFRRLAEAGFEGIGIMDGDRLIDANTRLAEMLGCQLDTLLSLPVADLIAPEAAERVLNWIRYEHSRPITHLARRINGTLFPVETQSRRLIQSGRTSYVIAIRDMSERVRLEEQLRLAQKLQAVGQLAGGLSHDFNNLLTIIMSYTDLLIDQARTESLPTWIQHDLEQIQHAGQRAASLTRQLLAFSRRQVLDLQVLDLNTVVTNILPMIQRLMTPTIKFISTLANNLDQVRADPGQIEQVIINLAANGRDAMPDGGTLTIETRNMHLDELFSLHHAELEPGDYVLLSIRDTGVGMSPETQTHIFEPFFTTKERGRGTGLGLATAHGIMKQSGGHIWFTSEIAHGTTFTICLPRIGIGAVRVQPERTIPNIPIGHEMILLVEDDPGVRASTRSVLEHYGYRVIESDNLEAEQHHRQSSGTIDLLLTDVVMPGIDGAELARRLVARQPNLGVLFMSGYTDSIILHHGIQSSSTAFVQKPFTPLALIEKIRSILDEQSKAD